MATKVGPKGQVVIDRHIRDALGVQPGMLAIQRLVDGFVEIQFVPAPHRRSLAGAARPFVTRFPAPEERDNTDDLWVDEVENSASRSR
jgi:bifunctional DNA-binding transcriptional regulator/antitoxin component of YhaV-PrlF toxin-antitoxin module